MLVVAMRAPERQTTASIPSRAERSSSARSGCHSISDAELGARLVRQRPALADHHDREVLAAGVPLADQLGEPLGHEQHHQGQRESIHHQPQLAKAAQQLGQEGEHGRSHAERCGRHGWNAQPFARCEGRDARLEGGDLRQIAKGDVIIVPHGVPHQFLEVTNPFLYYVVKVR